MELTPPPSVTKPDYCDPDYRYSVGYCYLEKFEGVVSVAASDLGPFPNVKDTLLQPDAKWTEEDEEEWEPWCVCLPEWEKPVYTKWNDTAPSNLHLYTFEGQGVNMIHIGPTENVEKSLLEQLAPYVDSDKVLGVLISDLVAAGADVAGASLEYMKEVLATTNALSEDAADNYWQLGNAMEKVADAGGVKVVARSSFVEMTTALVGRWAKPREAAAAANVAAAAVYSDAEWDASLFEKAMDVDEDEEEKQSRLLRMMGMIMHRRAGQAWSSWVFRKGLKAWKADLLGPAKGFARAFGVTDRAVDDAAERAMATGAPLLKNAVEMLKENALPALKVMSIIASGGAVAAGLIVSAGIVMDWYYADKEQLRLGPVRETIGEVDDLSFIVKRAQEVYAVSAILSDEVYDTVDYTHTVRLDPFFFAIKNEVSLLADDTAASRLVSNTFLAPLINTATAGPAAKNMLLLPSSVSHESAMHLQKALPMFYFRIVNRAHSHPELWAVRRAYELMVSRFLVADGQQNPVVMLGANVRQVSKLPRVCMNYGPSLTGRDDSRRKLKGTAQQRNFYRAKTVDMKFAYENVRQMDLKGSIVRNGIAVSFFSTQDMSKQEFVHTCIRGGITQAYIAVNVPLIMMDERIRSWDDPVLNVRYVRRDGVLSMSILGLPVAGYDNSYEATMSWVKPHKPVHGYDVTVEAVAQVGSSYLLYLQIGVGHQESHDTLWKMPDSGHYVLPDLTREHPEMEFFAVPEAKFDEVVKFVIQSNGAKDVFVGTTGRIMGLQAAIKIGGVTLDRGWKLSHREYISVAVHAISCAGVDKADAVHMMGKLREFFGQPETRSWLEKAKNGYRKLLGWEVDRRVPGVAARGRSDYDVVTHWTCRQKSGWGQGESFDPESDEPGFMEREVGLEKADKKTFGFKEPETDSGYVSAEDLNVGDSGGVTSLETDKEGFMSFFSKWRKSVDSKDAAIVMDSIGDVSISMRLELPPDVGDSYTTSLFDPTGALTFVAAPNQSKSNELFLKGFSSEADVLLALRSSDEFPAPDSGAGRICELAMKNDQIEVDLVETTLQAPGEFTDVGFLGDLQRKFFDDFKTQLRVPSLMIDGLAGSAKSTVVRNMIKAHKLSAVVVVPSRKLSRDWRGFKVCAAVTRHNLTSNVLQGRAWLIIDEVYAYTKAELACYLGRAAAARVGVILLGDRKQQYEDGAEITVEDIVSLRTPIMRFLVSNTMPLDAIHVLKWAASSDKFVELFQTRNPRRHSIFFVDPDHKTFDWVGTKSYENALVFKDRLEPRLGWHRTDEELGFQVGQMEDWMSVSRVQGSRADFSFLLCSRLTKSEKWFANQRGIFYVATSRHSKAMVMGCYQNDLSEISGLKFEHWSKVDGRLTQLGTREKFDAPMSIHVNKRLKDSPVLTLMMQRGMLPQLAGIVSHGPILEDWRPWPKMDAPTSEPVIDQVSHNLLGLVGSTVPYAETDAAKYPVFQAAMGLWKVRRPNFVKSDPIVSMFEGMNRLAVNQTSKDEVLDLKNVVERTARPRQVDHDESYIKAEGERLFKDVLEAFFDLDVARDFTVGPLASDWLAGRTPDFVRKFLLSDPFGLTSASVRASGFLKTQVKVKVKRTFAMEENYGQTVLASPPDYNAKLGPWSKVFLRNVRLASRRGVFLDSGYSDQELSRGLRNCGAFTQFMEENYQADVKKQDTSHTPVTLRVFRLFLEHFGVPEDLADMYERHSTYYRYRSLHAGLYDGQAENNLGSGDPFTLIRNIFQVLTVMVERFGVFQLKQAILVVKGDDFISNKIFKKVPVTVPEIRATQLTEDYNKPPYHAGRFLTREQVIPDPFRMICKAMVKPAKDMDRVNQLAEAFYDRYVCLSHGDYLYMRQALRIAYSDFDPALTDCILDLYCAMRNRSVFFDLVQAEVVGDRLVVRQANEDCAAYAVSFFISDDKVIDSVRNESADVIAEICSLHGVPVHFVTGRASDMSRRGVWLSENHAWAVICLDEDIDDEFKVS